MELRKEQLEEAWQLLRTHFGVDISEVRLLELAKILQMPIAEVTESELRAIKTRYPSWMMADIDNVITEFLAQRNAALQPKPDLREQIARLLYREEFPDDANRWEDASQKAVKYWLETSDRILAIIDAHKGGE